MTSNLFDDSHISRGDFKCPWCEEPNSVAQPIDHENTPKPGDPLICATCARPSIVQEHGKPRRPTEQEWKVLNADQHITDTRKATFMMNKGNVDYRDLIGRNE